LLCSFCKIIVFVILKKKKSFFMFFMLQILPMWSWSLWSSLCFFAFFRPQRSLLQSYYLCEAICATMCLYSLHTRLYKVLVSLKTFMCNYVYHTLQAWTKSFEFCEACVLIFVKFVIIVLCSLCVIIIHSYKVII
jgi:hypothetical protein